MDLADRLAYANDLAQAAFHEMLVNKTFSDPDATETLLYVASERAVDELLIEAQGKAGLDAALADGDHYLRPAGTWR